MESLFQTRFKQTMRSTFHLFAFGFANTTECYIYLEIWEIFGKKMFFGIESTIHWKEMREKSLESSKMHEKLFGGIQNANSSAKKKLCSKSEFQTILNFSLILHDFIPASVK